MSGEQLQDPDADWDREDPATIAPLPRCHPGAVDVVIPTEDVIAALADPSTAHLKEGGAAAHLFLVLGDHFDRDFGRKLPTLIVRAAKP